jgi:hypothetical protein
MILGLQKEKNLKSGIIFLRDLSNRNYSWAKHQKRIFYFRHSTGNREVFIRIYMGPNYFIQNIKIKGV